MSEKERTGRGGLGRRVHGWDRSMTKSDSIVSVMLPVWARVQSRPPMSLSRPTVWPSRLMTTIMKAATRRSAG